MFNFFINFFYVNISINLVSLQFQDGVGSEFCSIVVFVVK